MAERITLAQVQRVLEVFAREMGTETYDQASKAGRPIVGTYTLSVQRLEGFRIRVERYSSDRMTTVEPFGCTVRNARGMYETIHSWLDLLREQRAMKSVLALRDERCAELLNESPASIAANEALAGVNLEEDDPHRATRIAINTRARAVRAANGIPDAGR